MKLLINGTSGWRQLQCVTLCLSLWRFGSFVPHSFMLRACVQCG